MDPIEARRLAMMFVGAMIAIFASGCVSMAYHGDPTGAVSLLSTMTMGLMVVDNAVGLG